MQIAVTPKEKTSITWKLDVETQAFLPIGQAGTPEPRGFCIEHLRSLRSPKELDFECYCPFQQDGAILSRA